ncbi:nitrate regulatory gene2 protein-like [Benincasa hispida]|uniref:nitrate regulatory gene2 protein-like n=1 Tax=Benincasa hispida TaxID=102211 RepID=UPI0018FFA3AD|nr:nitrate regulatory gene2 protein-like [Benincasa hispida]
MGCASSKLDNLPAVALCRDRCKFLDQALIFTHSLVDSHSAYADSLNKTASALRRLFDQDGEIGGGDLKCPPPPPAAPTMERSDSDSDADSDSDSDSTEEEEDGCFNQEKPQSPPVGSFLFSNYDYARGQPPPPPPTGSSWDFFNFFETYERYEQPIFNWDREGADQKLQTTRVVVKKKKKPAVVVDSKKNDEAEKSNKPEKKIDDPKMGMLDLMREIKGSFEKASESSNSISKLLSYGQRMSFCKDSRTGSRGLLSILKKLCVWEQKLYLEVKAEERLRMILEKKCRQLKNLVEKKADTRKIDPLRNSIRNLSIKLKISIQVVDRISITISKLRDEEFLAEMNELIHGLQSMWKVMSESHKQQIQSLTDPKPFESILNGALDDAHLEAAMDLKLELENWRSNFIDLIATQKDCIKALNGWLLRCLLYEPEPEETPNGGCPPPFSPARIGAPPVFVIGHLWSDTTERFSDKDVSEAIQGLVSKLDQALEQQSWDLQRLALANKDLEKKIKVKKTTATNQGFEEKTMAVAAGTVHKVGKFSGSEIQLGLRQIFVGLTGFCGDAITVYEELCCSAIAGENQEHSQSQPGPP